jgi:hypothetical protein
MSAPTGPAHVELSATTELVVAVDKVYSSEALEHHLWERRGFLKRLARSHAPG